MDLLPYSAAVSQFYSRTLALQQIASTTQAFKVTDGKSEEFARGLGAAQSLRLAPPFWKLLHHYLQLWKDDGTRQESRELREGKRRARE